MFPTGVIRALPSSLKALNSLIGSRNFPGKWRIENFLVELVKVDPDFYFHPLGFWWRIDDKATKKTFLVNCENSTTNLVKKIFGTKKIVFVDIGANLGWYSLLATSLNSNSEVFAFEPMNSIREKLQRNLNRNRYLNTHVESCALGAYPHSAQMWSYSGNDGMHTLHPIEEWDAKPSCEVKIEVLDRYTTLFCEPNLPILMKMDVEGSEMDILKGGTSLLQVENIQMIIEVNEKMLLTGGASANELFAFLRSFGFSGYWISPDMTLVSQRDELPLPHRGKLPDFEGANYFFTKSIEAVELKVNLR